MNLPDITYLKVTSRARREFVLREDHLVFNGQGSGMRFESKLMLSDLRSEPDKLWLRDPAVRLGQFYLCFSPLMFGLAFVLAAAKGFPEILVKAVFAAAIGCLVGGVVYSWKYGVRLEYARFLNRSGIVALDIARRGPQQLEFDDFVSELSKRIAATQDN